MENYFSGEFIKKTAKQKSFKDVVYRFEETTQKIEFHFKDGEIVSKEIYFIRNKFYLPFVDLYAYQNDTDFIAFCEFLKNKDDVYFFVEDGTPQSMKETGPYCYHIRAQIWRIVGNKSKKFCFTVLTQFIR